jgi:hypothetical protein
MRGTTAAVAECMECSSGTAGGDRCHRAVPTSVGPSATRWIVRLQYQR